MGNFKKIIIITSIALNVVFVILFMAMLLKMAVLNSPHWGWGYLHSHAESLWSSKDHKNKHSKHSRDDDHHYREKMVARDFARQVFSNPEVKRNLIRFYKIHREIIALSEDKNYNRDNERRIQQLFDEFEGIFLTNKNIVEEKIITHMREMDPQERSYLIRGFLRMSPASRVPE